MLNASISVPISSLLGLRQVQIVIPARRDHRTGRASFSSGSLKRFCSVK
jgi:hypothetical protein